MLVKCFQLSDQSQGAPHPRVCWVSEESPTPGPSRKMRTVPATFQPVSFHPAGSVKPLLRKHGRFGLLECCNWRRSIQYVAVLKYQSHEDRLAPWGWSCLKEERWDTLKLKATLGPVLFIPGRELLVLPWREEGPTSSSQLPPTSPALPSSLKSCTLLPSGETS